MQTSTEPVGNLEGHAARLGKLGERFKRKVVEFVPGPGDEEGQRNEFVEAAAPTMVAHGDDVEVAPGDVVVSVNVVHGKCCNFENGD